MYAWFNKYVPGFIFLNISKAFIFCVLLLLRYSHIVIVLFVNNKVIKVLDVFVFSIPFSQSGERLGGWTGRVRIKYLIAKIHRSLGNFTANNKNDFNWMQGSEF